MMVEASFIATFEVPDNWEEFTHEERVRWVESRLAADSNTIHRLEWKEITQV